MDKSEQPKDTRNVWAIRRDQKQHEQDMQDLRRREADLLGEQAMQKADEEEDR